MMPGLAVALGATVAAGYENQCSKCLLTACCRVFMQALYEILVEHHLCVACWLVYLCICNMGVT
jgi:hypothetical protein